MEKSKTVETTASLNARAFAAKKQRRIEKARYSPERKMEIVESLRKATRELRTKSQIIKRGEIDKD